MSTAALTLLPESVGQCSNSLAKAQYFKRAACQGCLL